MIIHILNEPLLQEVKLLYVEIPRAGCTTIKYELFWKRKYGELDSSHELQSILKRQMHDVLGYIHTETLEPYKDYFKFTVVRDPYTRFISGFYGFLHNARNSFISKTMGIQDYPDEIFSDPNTFLCNVNKEILNRNPHTALQTYLLPGDLNVLDYIGRLENMAEVENTLSHVLREKIQFGWENKGQGADYYSIRIDVDRFNQIFMEDYETLNAYYSPLQSTMFSNSKRQRRDFA
jgi:hypothetical protein